MRTGSTKEVNRTLDAWMFLSISLKALIIRQILQNREIAISIQYEWRLVESSSQAIDRVHDTWAA